MAKRKASTASDSDTTPVTRRNVRQKTSYDPLSSGTSHRTLDCVYIPASEQLACIQSVQSTAEASDALPRPGEDRTQPVYERPLLIGGKRPRKTNLRRSTIADFFRIDSTPRAGKDLEKNGRSQGNGTKHEDTRSQTSSGEASTSQLLLQPAVLKQDEEEVKHESSGRARRSAARQSYVMDMLEDSEDELSTAAPAPRRGGRIPSAKKATADSDFEHESEGSEGDVSQDEEQSESAESEPGSEPDGSDKGYGSGLKSKRKSKGSKMNTSEPSQPRGTSKTGKKTGKATAAGMLKFLNRPKGEQKGLNLSLPPLFKIDKIFQDIIAKALTKGLKELLAGGIGYLRVATMCSGTESPLLALEMVQDALKSAGAPELKIDHLFSAEIVPYKQAYIERNFHPPIIFRDISEITDSIRNNSMPTATTVYGAKLPVPGNVHILIAGTSCVDFSRLNKHRKTLDQEAGGESSKTWFGVLSYVKACRPAIVILENVLHGPWDLMMQSYREIGYEVGGVLLDSKNYYLPQTRQRGYLVCFDTEKSVSSVEGAGKRWQSMMGEFRRYASSSVADFMLPNEMVRAQQYGSIDDTTRDYNWEACEIRHIQYRQGKRLGNGRPLTFWSESGTMSVPENGFQSWYRKQPERVRDYMDIALLRKAPLFDVRHKTRIWDVSQNVDLFGDSTSFGITPCITPSGLFFASDAGRALAPEELLMMQGLPLNKISFTTESASEIQDLAGNAMTTTVVGIAILSAIICGQSVLHHHQEASVGDKMEIDAPLNATIADEPTETVLSSTTEEPDLAHLIDQAAKSAQHCLCEGAHAIAEKPIQKCINCGHTTCTACGGNPKHNYQLELPLQRSRSYPAEFEQYLRSCLPQCLTFQNVNADEISTHKDEYSSAATKTFLKTYCFSRIQRTHRWKAIYEGPSARLEFVLDGPHAHWKLFARPSDTLPANSKLRVLLEQPVAVAECGELLLSNDWKWRSLSPQSYRLQLTSEGPMIASWLARIGLTDYREQQVPSMLRVELPADAVEQTGHDLSGRYQALPQCGTAEDSLYKKLDNLEGQEMYLLKHPSRTGDPKLDCFVFSQDIERLDYSDYRPVVASIDPAWAPWVEGKEFNSPDLTLAADWQPLPSNMRLCAVDPGLQVQAPSSFGSSSLQLHCRQAQLVIQCSLAIAASQGVRDIDAKDEHFFTEYAYAIESMRRHLPASEWRPLSLDSCLCQSCAPLRPGLRWMLNDSKGVKPYDDPASAAIYERSIKQRPNPMFFQLRNTDGYDTIRLGLNLASLAHRAIARLPHVAPLNLSWNLEQSMASGNAFKQNPFMLKQTEDEASLQDVGMKCKLFPKQAAVLQWMRLQEVGHGKFFVIEEAEEASVPAIGWRAEVRAQVAVNVRGGICADHPGFGKTITSLALIHSHLSTGKDIVVDLRQRQDSCGPAKGLIATQATLIVAPNTLVKQWASEIRDKLGYSEGVLVISSWKDLNKYNISDFEKAKIIIVNRSVLGQAEYAERLANFAAMPGPATNSGRAFSQWLEHACQKVPEHLDVLQQRGLSELRKHVKKVYAELLESEEFKAVIPSRRLVGRELTESKGKGKSNQNVIKAAPNAVQTDNIHRPLFEMFYFNRIIVDEFHQYTPREYASLKALKADKRWGLSGTPALSDFYDIAQMAGLLGIKLRIGSDSARTMAQRNVRALRKDMTDFERFDSMREMPSDSMHARIHEVAQMFLDAFVRQNVMDFDEMTYDDHVVPVMLDPDHHSAYSELAQQLSSQDMNIRKAKSAKTTTRDKRFTAAIADVQTAEEALSRDAAWFEAHGLDRMINTRQKEVDATLKDLGSACFAAQHEVQGLNKSLQQTVDTLLEERVLGDQETIDYVKGFLASTAPAGVQIWKEGKKPKKKKKKKSSTDEDDAFEAEESKGDKKARVLTSNVNALAKALLTSVRSKRYVSNVQRIRMLSSRTEECDSKECSERGTRRDERSTAVSALCGHRVCMDCYGKSKAQHRTICNAGGCGAPQQDFHLLWSHTLNQSNKSTSHGAKLDQTVCLLRNIRAKGEKAILFVQFSEQLDQADSALQEADIAATVVAHQNAAGQQIADFHNNEDTVIVLNASDETAAGSNLQAANHVIFLSPLLRDSQYGYDSTMAQAIGRVRRHGQQRRIHVYRLCALHTIDIDILEHRERRTAALVEPGASPVKPTVPASEQDCEHDASKPERVQLVKENGKFSLRPRSWLHTGGTEGADEAEMLRLGGKNRVAGWEDFSSQIKFSRAFAGNE